jgi:hypothetical protein
MRTTLALDDDVLEQVKRFAEDRRMSLGRAASELIRRGVSRPVPTRMVNGLHVFDPPSESPMVTSEEVYRLEADQDLEQALKWR